MLWFHGKFSNHCVGENWWNYHTVGNLLSHFFGKNFVKVTVLIKKWTSWFDEIFFRWEWNHIKRWFHRIFCFRIVILRKNSLISFAWPPLLEDISSKHLSIWIVFINFTQFLLKNTLIPALENSVSTYQMHWFHFHVKIGESKVPYFEDCNKNLIHFIYNLPSFNISHLDINWRQK